ncbi:tubulin polymerization-promoting protein family member 2-like [Porites lutea]|uniref:tubulin polymerization-promoting protein family member 2-like n=1 Tax=Porites lutea TaxID=51062 RepID=UPI003CC563BC
MSDGDLKTVFNSFCAFGAGSKDAQATMDNAKFGKLFRDLKLYDKKFTSTDTDIIFNRPEVKSKTERKINFSQFKKALELCAEKKYGSKDDLGKLIEKICAGKGPATSGATKAVKAGGVDRLTDTSKYTGSHKERFDESGKGKGIEGRVDRDDKAAEGYVGGYKGKDTYDKTH